MKILRFIDKHFEEFFCTLLMIFFVALCNLQVLTRYFFTSVNIPWTEEIARYSFIFMVYLGLSWTIKVDNTLKVDILKMLLPEKGRLVQEIITGLIVIAASIAMGYYSYIVFVKQVVMMQLLPASGLPIAFIWFCYPFAFLLAVVRQIQRIILLVKKGAA